VSFCLRAFVFTLKKRACAQKMILRQAQQPTRRHEDTKIEKLLN